MKEFIWKEHEGYQQEKPLSVDTDSSPTTVYLRRNIREVPNIGPDGEEGEGTHWKYEEAELTPDEYALFSTQVKQEDLEAQVQYVAMMTGVDLDA